MLALKSTDAMNGPEEPLLKLLVRLREEQMTGQVRILDDASRSSVVYVRRGRPVHVQGSRSMKLLGDLLVEAGLVPTAALDEALVRQKETGQLLGDLLCEQGLVDLKTLREMLTWQLHHKLDAILAVEPSAVRFIAGEH